MEHFTLSYEPDSFSRQDESDDEQFYARERLVDHLDRTALQTIERVLENLIDQQDAIILDLMASWDSHLSPLVNAGRVIGLGLNRNELEQNNALSELVIHDLNKNPTLPFRDDFFDVVINVVSVDYLVHPFEVFAEVGRVLKPAGLFIVVFSHRMFPQKAVKIWRDASDEEKMLLVSDFFAATATFGKPGTFVSRGKPRPSQDKYAAILAESDPVFVMYASKKTNDQLSNRQYSLEFDKIILPSASEISQRKQLVKENLLCPYCKVKMKKWLVPQSPFTQWDNEYMFVCFNDTCPYLMKGWQVMQKQGNWGISYRLQYNPSNNAFYPMPVLSLTSFRESIIEEDS